MATLSITARTANTMGQIKTQALVALVPDKKTLSPPLKALDKLLGGTVTNAIRNGDFSSSLGSHHWLPGNAGVQRVLLIGCGDIGGQTVSSAKKLAETLARSLMSSQAKDALVWTDGLTAKVRDASMLLEQIALQLTLAHYQYEHTLNQRKKPARPLKRVAVSPGNLCSIAQAKRSVAIGGATGQGANLTRELVNLPGNICTPKYLSGQARKLARMHSKLSVSVLDEQKMASLGMHSLLSVGNGSDQPSQLIVIKYQGASAKTRPYCLVGKGITFDSGGYSIKPSASMFEMKWEGGYSIV